MSNAITTAVEADKSDFEIFATAARFNSGSHFLDSGGAYGRHWQRPPLEESKPAATLEVWRNEVTATIETAHLLAEHLKVDRDTQKDFEAWQADRDGDWFSLAEEFATDHLGLVQRARDNTYNGENDLSQVYIWEVYTPRENAGDWIYDDEALSVIFIHTGCDVRGGYSAPIFCRGKGEFVIPMDTCAEFFAIEARDADGNEIETGDIDEHWRTGWSSHPSYEITKDISRVFSFTATPESVCVKLTTGEIVKVGVEMPCC